MTDTLRVRALHARLRIFWAAWLRCSSLNGMTIQRRLALPDSPKNTHSGVPNCGFQVELLDGHDDTLDFPAGLAVGGGHFFMAPR